MQRIIPLKFPVKINIYILVNHGGTIELDSTSTILNGSYPKDIFLTSKKRITATISLFNCLGKKISEQAIEIDEWTYINVK